MLNKTVKIIGIVCTAIVVSVLGWIYYRGESYFKAGINEFLSKKTNGVYYLEYDKIEIGLFDRDLKIYNLNLQFDTIKAKQILTNDSTVLFFNVNVKEFSALDFEYNKIFNQEIIQINELRLNSPKVSTHVFLKKRSDKKSYFSKNHGLKNLFKEININKISLENADYNIYSKLVKEVKFSAAKRIDILVDQFHSNPSLIANEQYFDIEDLSLRFLSFESVLGDDIHTLKADTLDFSLKKSYLSVSNLAIFPKNIQKDKNYFNLKIPQVNLRLKAFNLHAFDSLIVDDLTLERPQIKFYKNREDVQKETINQEYGELRLYDLIKNDFKKAAVNHLKISEAAFHYYTKAELTQKIEKLDLELHQFSIDSISEKNPDKIFYANDFKMDVHDFELNLKDQVHLFKINNFQLSSFKQDVSLKGISIKPTHLKEKMSEKFFLNTDEVLIKKIDFKKLYHYKSLEMNQLFLSEVKMRNELYKGESKSKEKSKLKTILKPILNQVKAKEVYLKDASIDFQDFRIAGKLGRFKTKINFHLNDLNVDILRFKEDRRVLFSKNFDLVLEDYEFKAPKDVNIYRAKRIALENKNSQIQIDHLKIEPEIRVHEALKRYKIASLMNASAKQIKIEGIDFQKLIFDRELNAELFEIDQPLVDIETHEKFKKKKIDKKFDPKEIEGIFYTALNYMPQIKVNRIQIPNGKIHLKTANVGHDIKTNIHNTFNIQIDQFLFNEEEMKKTGKDAKVFFSENTTFTIENQTLNIGDGVHKITADHISFHSKDNSLHIRNGVMFPDRKASKYDTVNFVYQVVIPELNIIEFDLIKAYETDTISIGKVNLSEAEIKLLGRPKKDQETKKFDFKNFYIPLPENVKALELRKLNIERTLVETYREDRIQNTPVLKASFEITSDWKNFILINNGIGKKTNFQIDDAYYHLKKINLPLKDEVNIKMDDLKFNVMKGDLRVDNFTFEKGNQTEIEIKQFILDDLNPEKLYYDDFVVKSIFIDQPKIKINPNQRNKKINKKDSFKINTVNVYPTIENFFNYIKAETIKINDIDLQIGKIKHNPIDLELKDVLIDENYNADRFLHSKNIILNIHNIQKATELYHFNAERLTFSINPAQLLVENIQVKPTFSKNDYRKVMKNQVDRVDAKIDYVKIEDIDVLRWLERSQLVANKVEVGPSEWDLYKDKRVSKIVKVKHLPQALLNKIEKEFFVNQLNLKPSSVYYSEYSGNTPKGGRIYFDSLYFTLNNITNIPEKMKYNNKSWGKANALLMGVGHLAVDLEFDLLAENELHKIEGSLTDFPLNHLNEIIEETSGIRIRDGYTHRLDFKMDLTNKNAIGNVNFMYDNLNIALLDKNRLKEKKFFSRLTNLLLNNQSNKKQEKKSNIIYLERDEQKSFIGYWWRSIWSGLKYSFGVKSKQQKEIKKQMIINYIGS